MKRDYLVDPSSSPDPGDADIVGLEEKLAGVALNAELDWQRTESVGRAARRQTRRRLAIAGAVLAAAAAVILFVARRERPTELEPGAACLLAAGDQPFRVEPLRGAPSCGGAAVTTPVILAEGAWLETDDESSARVAVALVGDIEISPGSRLRLVKTGPDEHRFDLRRGRIHAAVDAPPRLFVVTTPNADAVDLGCEYDLSVAEDGSAELVVTGGSVSLEGLGREISVPAGYRAATLPGIGPTPAVPIEASEAFYRASIDFTRSRSVAALTVLLVEASDENTATLIGALPFAEPSQCAQLHARLQEVSPISFPWQRTSLGCDDVAILFEAWTNLLAQTW